MLKQLILAFALVSLFGVFTLAQEQTDSEKKEKQECSKNCCEKKEKQSDLKPESMDNSTMVREGEIDLVAIDLNEDGMVFQDQMCWNVISDEPGECPQCGMVLKEVSLEKAKANLEKNDYEVI
jgi:hypothetical protein